MEETIINAERLKQVLEGFREAICYLLNSNEQTQQQTKEYLDKVFEQHPIADKNSTELTSDLFRQNTEVEQGINS